MFHEEKVIDGVLCYRSTPGGVWIECSKEQLTTRILESNQRLSQVSGKLEQVIESVQNIQEKFENLQALARLLS